MILDSLSHGLVQCIFCRIKPSHQQQMRLGNAPQDRIKCLDKFGHALILGQSPYEPHNRRRSGNPKPLSDVCRSG